MSRKELVELPPQTLLKPAEAAQILGLSCVTLAKWRWNGANDLPFLKLGPKIVRYRKGDLDRFLEDQ